MSYFEHEGCKLHYETEGNGQPLVLLHGLAADCADWLPVRALLAKYFLVVMPDNRLSGRSACPPGSVSAADLAGDVRALLDHLGLKKSSVVGHSMGGYVAQEFALRFPERLDKLVLEGTGAACSARNAALLREMAVLAGKNGYSRSFWRLLLPWMISPKMYSNPSTIDLMVKVISEYPYMLPPEKFAASVEIIAAHDASSRLSGVKAETLVISGGHDILMPAEEGRALADAIPGARFAYAKEAGHSVHFELPDVFAQAVTVFLRGELPAPDKSAS